MGHDQKIPGAGLSRRNMLRLMATATGAAVLAACGKSAGTPAAGDAASAEPIELTYMTPDRELGQKVDKMAIASFNERMKKKASRGASKACQGRPPTMTTTPKSTSTPVQAHYLTSFRWAQVWSPTWQLVVHWPT